MRQAYFVTGTDTDVGKTWVTLGLISAFQTAGLTVNGMKPVASGCQRTDWGLRNSDALALQAASFGAIDYSFINPYAYEPAIAPHIAAQQAKNPIQFRQIKKNFEKLTRVAECTIVEGVGGWRVPLGEDGDVAALAEFLNLPVILVVGLKLGCINHALLSIESIERTGVKLVGWVGNLAQNEFVCLRENIETLTSSIEVPCLGIIPHLKNPVPNLIAAHLDIGQIAF